MVDNSSLRDKIAESTRQVFGSLQALPGQNIREIFGTTKINSIGASNYYDVEAFYASVNVHVGNDYNYVYNQFKSEMKPRIFKRFSAGVKLKEEQFTLDPVSLATAVEHAAQKQERGLRTALEEYAIGYRAEKYLVSVLNAQPTANSSIIDPADCNSTPGTAAALTGVNFIGAGKTERALEATVGVLIRLIGAKVLDTTTGESILRNDGTDTFDLWCHPIVKHILDTAYELLDAGETDNITYTERLKLSWKTTVRATMQIDAPTGATDNTALMILTANTAENFFIVDVEEPTWTAWKEIDNGSKIEMVKRYKAGEGAVATPYITGTQAYKAMAVADVTPNGA